VAFEFGSFRLDEAGRMLSLSEREMPLQPRVFDLLVYLVNSRARVVPKNELLDALWPGVTVTENSLQRAVSTLRAVLREGGMENAIRNFPRTGYRFCIDAEADGSELPRDAEQAAPRQVEAARRAMREQRWSDAAGAYAAADAAGPLAAGELVSWSHALQCLGRPSDAIPLLVRAVAAHTRSGSDDCGARTAITLSTIHLERGETAVAKGWLARVEDLVERHPDCLAAGELLWMKARIIAMEGDPHQAIKFSNAAYEFGRRHGDVRIETLGLMYRGFYRLSIGEIQAGLSDQDHAGALALSHQVDPITGGVLYCNILWACRTFGDWARANEWTLGYQSFCAQNHMGFSGSCQLHRAECLGVQGSLAEAREHILDSISRLPADAPWALGDAYRVLGDIEAATGNGDAAITAYERCYGLGWSPEPGHAMLLIERGQVQAAYASLERSLIGNNWWTLQRKGLLLAHMALAAAHAGQHEKVLDLIAELSAGNERWPMASVKALTSEASALLARALGKQADALSKLHLARQLWTSIDSRLNAARLRLEIAELQMKLGDGDGARDEIRAALASAEMLGSDRLVSRCRSMLARVG
jgi:DNA-binding winged helix-turn-helix (wHTH) protein